ncbi:MAG TPA: ATP-binding protein [Chryseosolibacter sp.]
MQVSADDIILLVVIGTLIFLVAGLFVVIYVFTYNEKKRKHLEEKSLLQQHYSQVLLQAQLEIKEQTLQHIGFELHDNLGQVASLVKIHLTTLRFDDPVNARRKVEDALELTRQLIMDLKSLSLSLNTNRVAQVGIVTALQNEVERLNKTGRFQASLVQEGAIPPFDDNTTVILFRMMQEAVNNAIKHSQAKSIVISLHATENLFRLACTDDGQGFDIHESKDEKSSGLMNLRSRAKLINAELHILSSPMNGTTISIELAR